MLSRNSREHILELLSAMGVDLPPKTKLPDAELDKRLAKALDSAQYISRVVPTTPFDPATLPTWSSSPNAPDLRQTMMALGACWDDPQGGPVAPIVVQDAEKEISAIPMRIVDVRMFDASTPVLVVLYRHDVSGSASLPETLGWVQANLAAGRAIRNVTATMKEQEMLLRMLKQNSKRLAKSYKAKRTATEKSFMLSFLLPVGPLTAKDMAKFNANNGCTVCGDPAKSKCARCAVMRYCGSVCQKEDWKTHRSLCKSWESAIWHRITFTTRGCRPNGIVIYNIGRFDIVQHGDIYNNNSLPMLFDSSSPQNTHGATPFIVKVQVLTKNLVGPDGKTMVDPDLEQVMFYDKSRALDVLFLRSPETEADFRRMGELVRRQGNPAKGFVWALRTGDWTIDVCVNSFPEPQKW
ncbi:MYND-type domain-containing protein [Mycena kentingensis (nom. inval.)]|nr:MYND-type domain-containing protein [Mycena kentingensis (nom. inval.)]